MTQSKQASERKQGTPGGFSRWMQQKMNARTNRKIRRGDGKSMGMELLILNTVGRHSGETRETPVAWFADTDDSWLIVASGGGSQHPDWYFNLMAHPDRASIELPGRDILPVTPEPLEGADREQAWQRIAAHRRRPTPHREVPEQIRPGIPGGPAQPSMKTR